MAFEHHTVQEFKVTGVALRTNNNREMENPTIPAFWQDFFAKGTSETLLAGKHAGALYVVYTDYESDFMGEYTMLLGYDSQEVEVSGFEERTIPSGNYLEFIAQSVDDLLATWMKIWQAPLKRTYRADFELHDLVNNIIKVYVGVE